MAVPENADVKVDSSEQNLDNNTASLETTMMPPSPDDQNPESNSSVETPNSTKGSEGALKSEISHMDVKFSKLNPMAKEYVPQPLAPTLPVFVENSLWFTNSFAMQAFSAEDNDLFDTRVCIMYIIFYIILWVMVYMCWIYYVSLKYLVNVYILWII